MQTQATIIDIDVNKLIPLPSNPNHIDTLKFEELKNIITKYGFLQPITVREHEEDGFYQIIDGFHRWKASVELGMDSIPCVLSGLELDDIDSRALQIGMNKLRGEMDMSEVATIFTEMIDSGWTQEELSITGFDPEDISFMLDSMSREAEDIMSVAPEPDPEPKETYEDDSKVFVLELSFTEKSKFNKAKRLLKKASGTGQLSDGLINLLEEV